MGDTENRCVTKLAPTLVDKQIGPDVTKLTPAMGDEQQDGQLMQQLRHLEAAHMLGELSILKFQVLRLAEQVK